MQIENYFSEALPQRRKRRRSELDETHSHERKKRRIDDCKAIKVDDAMDEDMSDVEMAEAKTHENEIIPVFENTNTDLRNLHDVLSTFIGSDPPQGFPPKRWDEFRRDINEIRKDVNDEQEFRVIMLGQTGSGKSSLVNVLLGYDVLPTNSHESCTPMAIHCRYHEVPSFKVCIEYFSVEEMTGLISTQCNVEKQAVESEGHSRILESLFGEGFRQLKIEELLDARNFPSYTKLGSIQEHAFEGEDDVWDFFSQWTDKSKPSDLCCIKHVTLYGPFEVLKYGGVITDLPGIGDIDQRKDTEFEKHTDAANFIFMVDSIKRAADTKALWDTMSSIMKCRFIAMGQTNWMGFILTHIDHYNDRQYRKRNCGEIGERIQALRTQIKSKNFRDQQHREELEAEKERLCIGYQVNHSKRAIQNRFQRESDSKMNVDDNSASNNTIPFDVFAVSSTKPDLPREAGSDWDELKRFIINKGATQRMKAYEQGCAKLRSRLNELINGLDRSNHDEATNEKIAEQLAQYETQLIHEAEAFVRTERDRLICQIRIGTQSAINLAEEILKFYLGPHSISHNQLREQLKISDKKLKYPSLKATLVRHGQFCSKKVGSINMNEAFSYPLTSAIAVQWNTLFTRLEQTLKTELCDRLNKLYVDAFNKIAGESTRLPPTQETFATQNLRRALRRRIRRSRARYDSICAKVKAELMVVYTFASTVKGRGSYEAITTKFRDFVRREKERIFREIENELTTGLITDRDEMTSEIREYQRRSRFTLKTQRFVVSEGVRRFVRGALEPLGGRISV